MIIPKTIPKDFLEEISNTLTGLMNLESVRKKLESKKLFVKIVERRWVSSTQGFRKTISYVNGQMTQNVNNNMAWKFLMDNESAKHSENGEKMKNVITKKYVCSRS